MANVTVNSPVSVSVDGTDFGSVSDAIANNLQLASDIQAALVAYDAAQIAAHQQTISDYNAYQQVAQQALNVAGQALNQPGMTDAQKLAAIKGAYMIATAPAGQVQRQQIQAQIAKLTAQLAQLPQPPALSSSDAPPQNSSASSPQTSAAPATSTTQAATGS